MISPHVSFDSFRKNTGITEPTHMNDESYFEPGDWEPERGEE